MDFQSIPGRPVPGDLRSQQERAARDFALFSEEALPDRASVAPKTTDQRDRVWAKWELWAKNVVGIDPNQTWIDFCLHCNTATTYIRMFLKAYVENSYELRVCLGPEEYEWVSMVTTGVALMDVWKSLVGSADMKVLQEKRQEEPHNQAQWKLVFHEGRGHTSNPAYKWLREKLVDIMQLKREQTFEKVPATAEDITLYLDVLWRRAMDVRCSPKTRIAFHAVLLLSSIGGFRPGTLMQMPFSQVQLAVVRDPLDKSRTQLVATFTIYQNKQASKKIGRKQDDVVKISITIVPWPLLCIVSQVIVVALEKNAFETPFSSMGEILCRPIMEDVDYVPLRWKKDMEHQTLFEITYPAFYELWYQVLLVAGVREPPRPYSMRVGAGGRLHKCLEPHLSNFILSHTSAVFQGSYQPVHVAENLPRVAFARVLQVDHQERLYALLANSSLHRDENAPIYPKKEDIESWEQRSDLQNLRIEYETVRRKANADRPETKRIAARIQSIRDKLEELTIDRERKTYFERVDTLRASGMPIPGELSQSSESHRRRFHEASSEGAAAIGKFLCQKTPSNERTVDFVQMGLAYLGQIPASAKTVADRCLTTSSEAGPNVRSSPVPAESPQSDTEECEQTYRCIRRIFTLQRDISNGLLNVPNVLA
ncbi:hypothetical protein Landi51_06406 [Colletotrichum acutatum]